MILKFIATKLSIFYTFNQFFDYKINEIKMRKLKNSELKRLNIEEFKKSDKTPIIVILDNIRSLNNIGSVFRTSDAFLIEKIILCGITAQPPHKDIHKTALGATESISWEYINDTIEAIKKLKEEGYIILSIEQTEKAIMLQDFKPEKNEKYVVVFGNEVKGVQQEVVNLSDYAIEIPQYGTKHSFNISVSAGIVLWEMFRKINSRLVIRSVTN
jgi:tRNA G18 (ribose-2'-O)-methylase SpoU